MLKWLIAAGIYGLLWLPNLVVWVFVSSETGALSHEWLLLLPPLVFCVVPLTFSAVDSTSVRRVKPIMYLLLTITSSLILLGIFGTLAKTVFSEYLLDHPAPVLWSWAAALIASPPIAFVASLALRQEARARTEA